MKELKPAIVMFIAFTIICGGIYPAVVTGIAQVAFPKQANGSFITGKDGRTAGSSLIGQPFSDPKYFWPRPSAAADFANNATGSSGSNSGPTNPDYLKTVADRVMALKATGITGTIPSNLVQASASGLDPHITPEAATIQVQRVAEARGIGEESLKGMVVAYTEGRQLGIIGEPRVNVLMLNLALDGRR